MKRIPIVVAALLATSVTASAQQPDVLDHFSLTAGSFLSSSSTTLRVDGEIPGTEFNFEEVIGLGESKTLGRFDLTWRFARKHSVEVGYYSLDRSRTDRIKAEIVFDDKVFPVDAVVESSLDLTFYDISYTYWPYRREDRAFGISGGLVGMSISAGLKGIPAGGDPALEIEGKASTDLPAPGIGVSYRQLFGEQFLLDTKVRFLPTITVGDYKGDTLNASAALEYRFLDHYGIGAAYNYFSIGFAIERPNFNGAIDYKIRGGQAYLHFFW